MITRTHFGRPWLLAGLLLAAPMGFTLAGQETPKADPLLLKAKAEQDKLLAAGDTCRTNDRPGEAMVWYRQAARAGSMEAAYRVGVLFLDGQSSAVAAQAVAPDPTEGVRWTFWAATNLHAGACREMGRIYVEGLGVKSNPVAAYAWMRLFGELDPKAGPAELDKLARGLDAHQIQEAQQLAGQFKNRQWPPPPCKRMIVGDERLKLDGLTSGGRSALAVINRRTLAEGETADIVIPKGRLFITCLEIRDQSVLVDIAGENETRLLKLR